MKVYLFTYNRPQMLEQTLRHLALYQIEPTIFHDGVTHPFRGKQGFWQTFDEALKDAQQSDDDFFLFMPDDFQEIDINRIKGIHQKFKHSPYVYNIINDGRFESWLPFKKQQPNKGTERVGYCDGGFFCNRSALQATKYRIKQPPFDWVKNPNLSSGIGRSLTFDFKNGNVPMYIPTDSLAIHGDHESQMNPEERLIHPLISK